MALTTEQVRTATQPIVYVARREGEIYGVWLNPPTDIPNEAVYRADADVQAFLTRTPPTLTPEQKLAAAGLSVNELKTLLGLE